MNDDMDLLNSSIFTFAPVPNWLLRNAVLTQGSKLLYGRLSQYCGGHGKCYPRHATLADELGVSVSQIKNYLSELIKAGLITSEQQHGKYAPNIYTLVQDHKWMGFPVLKADSHPSDCLEGQIASPVATTDSQSGGYNKRSVLKDHVTNTPPAEAGSVNNGDLFPDVGTPAAESAHSQFVRLWHEAFEAVWGYAYVMEGKKDGAAVARMLKQYADPLPLIQLAREAWHIKRTNEFASWAIKQSGVMHSFCPRVGAIRNDIEALRVKASKPAASKRYVPNI